MSIPSATIIGGLSSDFARNEADFYPTPPECTHALLNAFPWLAEGFVWEPACGDGAICKVLQEAGASVIPTDLHDRGYGVFGWDFLAQENCPGDKIITNPPFALAADFIRHARSFSVPFAMLLKSTYWHAASRQQLFQETGPAAVLPMLWRPNFAPERGSAPTMDVCWTVWWHLPIARCEYRLLPKPSMMTADKVDVFA